MNDKQEQELEPSFLSTPAGILALIILAILGMFATYYFVFRQ